MSAKIVRAETVLDLPIKAARWNQAVSIRPEQAKQLLATQPGQRPVVQNHVDALADEMKRGRFMLTNEALAFDEDGQLFDGQHRLWACFMSGVTITVLCCFNEPRANFDHIGTLVRRRSDADHLVIMGAVEDVALAAVISAASRFLWVYDSGSNPSNYSSVAGWGREEMRRTVGAHPGLVEMATFFRARRKLKFPLAQFVALSTLMMEAHPAKAATFMQQITEGENIGAGDPALTLRDAMLSRSTKANRGSRVEMAYKFVRAWNAFYAGRKLHNLYGSNAAGGNAFKVRTNGLDAFPRVAGHPSSRMLREQTVQPALMPRAPTVSKRSSDLLGAVA